MSNIKLFESKRIRSVWNEEEQKWYFSVVDLIEALTDSDDPKDYWYRMKKREKVSEVELSTFCRQLKLESVDGKKYLTDCSDVEGLLRIIQSIPSPKAEPFKRWLAKTGYERLEEIENPELAQKRIRETYLAKGYSDEWIEKRIRGINVRDELTNEWKKRGKIVLTNFSDRSYGAYIITQYLNFYKQSIPTELFLKYLNVIVPSGSHCL